MSDADHECRACDGTGCRLGPEGCNGRLHPFIGCSTCAICGGSGASGRPDEIDQLRAELGQRIKERDEWEANEQEQNRRAEKAEADLAVAVKWLRTATDGFSWALCEHMDVQFCGRSMGDDAATLRRLLTEEQT